MELSPREVCYIRLYKQGLIEPFPDLAALFERLDIQAQSEGDALFNINCRLSRPVSPDAIRATAIRLWYVRNTVCLLGRQHYPKALFVNRQLDNWFHKKRMTGPEEELALQQIIALCRGRVFITSDELLQSGCREDFVKAWSGAFPELARRGILKSKFGSQLELVQEEEPLSPSLEAVMRQYFDLYGPATLRDFKHWFGSSSREVTAAFSTIREDYLPVNGSMLLSRRDLPLLEDAREGSIPPIVLAKYDPVCLGYQDKSWLLEERDLPKVWGKAGVVRAVILLEGRIAALWKRERARILLSPLRPLTAEERETVEARLQTLFPACKAFVFC